METRSYTGFISNGAYCWDKDNLFQRAIILHYRDKYTNYPECAKNLYVGFKYLTKEGVELDQPFTEVLSHLIQIVLSLYGSTLVNIKGNSVEEMGIDQIDKMLKELEELDRAIENPSYRVSNAIFDNVIEGSDFFTDIPLLKGESEEANKSKGLIYFEASSENSTNIIFPEGIIKKACRGDYFIVPPIVTGNLDLDIAIASIKIGGVWVCNKAYKDYMFRIISEENMHCEIGHLINGVLTTLQYFVNSSSMRSKKLMPYDEYKYDTCLGMSNHYSYTAKKLLLHAKEHLLKSEV